MKKLAAILGILGVTFMGMGLSATSVRAGAADDDDYDRLDGHGKSGKKVNVIEWEGNLEIHVYPKGALSGLALKLDKANKAKPVMVIGYRFDGAPKTQLIRRAILGIDLREGFKTYRDPSSGEEYDKIIITNNSLAAPLASFKTDPEPTQLYPDGHPALAKKDPPKEKESRTPAANAPARPKPERTEIPLDEDGTIRPYQW